MKFIILQRQRIAYFSWG